MKKKENDFVENTKNTVEKILDTEDKTKDYTKKDIDGTKGMAILAYVLAPIPYFLEKKSKFVKFHALQGMNLFVVYLIYGIIYGILAKIITIEKLCYSWKTGIEYSCGKYVIPWFISYPLNILGVILALISLIGIINVINGKAKVLPIVGKIKIFPEKNH